MILVPTISGDERDYLPQSANKRSRRDCGAGKRVRVKRGYRRRVRHAVKQAERAILMGEVEA